MRGFNQLVKQEKLEYVENLKSKLIKISLKNDSYKGNNNDFEELCLQQFLTYRLLDKKFSEEILKSIKDGKKLNIILPHKWRIFLDKEGFKVNTFQNKLNWLSFELFYFFYGLSFGLIEFFNSFFRKKILGDYIYLYDLNERNFPRSKEDMATNNFVNWFIKSGYTKKNNHIVHSAKIRFNKIWGVKLTKSMGPLPPLSGYSRIYFLFWLVGMFFIGLVSQRTRILLKEKVLLKILELCPKENLANAYYFPSPWAVFKPLWTYEAERLGKEVVLYLYSTNIYKLIAKGKDESFYYNYWRTNQWKKFMVWNSSQKIYLKSKIRNEAKIDVVGPIPFFSSKHNFNMDISHYKRKILVFDVQPFRRSHYTSLGPYVDFYNYKNGVKFLSDINLIAKDLEAKVFIKRKRNTIYTSKGYLSFISNLVQKEKWIELDADFDAFSVSKYLNPNISINMPFTSTANVTSHYKIPSVYYDSLNQLESSKFSFLDIKLISNYKELKNWANSNI